MDSENRVSENEDLLRDINSIIEGTGAGTETCAEAKAEEELEIIPDSQGSDATSVIPEMIPNPLESNAANFTLETSAKFSSYESLVSVGTAIKILDDNLSGAKSIEYPIGENKLNWLLSAEPLVLSIPAIPVLLPSKIILRFVEEVELDPRFADFLPTEPLVIDEPETKVLVPPVTKPSKPDWMAKIDAEVAASGGTSSDEVSVTLALETRTSPKEVMVAHAMEKKQFSYEVFLSPFSRPSRASDLTRDTQPPQRRFVQRQKIMISGTTEPRTLSQFRPKLKPSQKRPWCWNCKGIGHERPQCPLRLEGGINNYTCFRCSEDGKTCKTCIKCGPKWRKQGPFKKQKRGFRL